MSVVAYLDKSKRIANMFLERVEAWSEGSILVIGKMNIKIVHFVLCSMYRMYLKDCVRQLE